MSEKTTILYVDDEMMNLMLFKRLFKDHFHILTAESGRMGLEVLASEKDIKAVVSDMKMPGMSGLEFASRAKNDFPDVVFFILTGFDRSPEIVEALNSKLISKYFGKPLNPTEIIGSIHEALNIDRQ